MTKGISKVKNYTIVQANDLIRHKKDFSLWELRIFALLAAQVKKDDEDFKTYKFRIRDIIDLFDTKSNNLYDEIRNVPEKLHSKLIKIPYMDEKGKKRMRRYNLVSMSDFPDEEKAEDGEFIHLRFDKDLKNMMLQLGENFTVYKFFNVLKLRSTYAFQLYEFLKSQEFKGRQGVEVAVKELREILQIPKSYKFGNITQRILNPSKKQLKKHTDIYFTYSPIKGRSGKYTHIRFMIFKNVQPLALAEGEDYFRDSEALDRLYPRVVAWGILRDQFEKWMDEYGEEQVERAIAYTERKIEQKEIKQGGYGGYFATMVKQKGFVDPEEEKRRKQEELRRKKEANRKQAKQLEVELEGIQKEYNDFLNNKIKELVESDPKVNSTTLQKIKDGGLIQSSLIKPITEQLGIAFDDLTVQDFRENDILRGIYKSALMTIYHEHFAGIEQYTKKITNYKRTIQELSA